MKTKCCHTDHYHVVDKNYLCLNSICEKYLSVTACELDFSKARKFLAIIIFTISCLFTFDDFSKANRNHEQNFSLMNMPENLSISVDNIETELKHQQIICSKEVLAQIIIESGHLSSYLLKRTNNMLGMRYPVIRKTTATGIYLPETDTIIKGDVSELKKYAAQNNYAVYDCWQDAIADYKLWQDANFKVNEKYLEFLSRNYAEDSLYVSKIKYITKGLKQKRES